MIDNKKLYKAPGILIIAVPPNKCISKFSSIQRKKVEHCGKRPNKNNNGKHKSIIDTIL